MTETQITETKELESGDSLVKDNEKLLEYLLAWEEEYKRNLLVSNVGRHHEEKDKVSDFLKEKMDTGLVLELVLKMTDDNLEDLVNYPEKVEVPEGVKARVSKYVVEEGCKDTCIRLPQLNAMPSLESGGVKLVLTPDFIQTMKFVKQA